VIETKSWLTKAKNRNLLNNEQYNLFYQQLEVIHFKLNAYIKYIGKNASANDGE
jgi:four helix bundle protein